MDGVTQCAYCRDGYLVETSGPRCSQCKAGHHRECWEENGGCTTFGCVLSPAR